MDRYKIVSYFEEINVVDVLSTLGIDNDNIKSKLEQYERNIINKMEEGHIESCFESYPTHLPYFENTFSLIINDGNLLNSRYNQILHETRGFDYCEWRQSNKFNAIPKIGEIKKIFRFEKNISKPILLELDDLINRINETIKRQDKFSFLQKKVESCLDNIIKVPDSNSCYCIELPFSEINYIVLGMRNDYKNLLIYTIHEIGHLIFNQLKFYFKIKVSIEEDEFWAHQIEVALINELFNEQEKEFYYHFTSSILKENIFITHFQYTLFLHPDKYQYLSQKNELFIRLNRIYNINIVSSEDWQYDDNIFSQPFYSACYINAQINALNGLDNVILEDVLEKFLKLNYN